MALSAVARHQGPIVVNLLSGASVAAGLVS